MTANLFVFLEMYITSVIVANTVDAFSISDP